MVKKTNYQLDSQLSTLNSVFITGTDTGVGKTVAAALMVMLFRKAGIDVGFIKPVQSGALRRGNDIYSQDASFMALAAGADVEALNNPYVFEPALSPHMAAKLHGERISLELIADNYELLNKQHEVVIVEGAGGLMVPINEDEYLADLAVRIGLPLVIVAKATLGTLNHTLLTVEAAQTRGLNVLGLVVNKYPGESDQAAESNLTELERITGLPVILTIPQIEGVSVEEGNIEPLAGFADRLDVDEALRYFLLPKEDEGLAADDIRYIWHPFTQMKEYENENPVIIESGRGSYLFDTDGRRYLDGVSSLWVNVHGHRHPKLDQALVRQAGKISHSTLLGLSNEPAIRLAKRLIEVAPPGLDKVFYSDSGSTAVEVALKISFQYWQQLPDSDGRKTKFVSFANAYHGDTIGSVSVGGIDLFHQKYRSLLFDTLKADSAYCYRCSLGLAYPGCDLACLKDLEATLKLRHSEIAAIVVEPKVQAAAGMLVSPPGYLRRIRDLADRYGVLLIADEVATGFGRTGSMFASSLEGVRPDILCAAKGITGGYMPLAATLTTERIYQAFYDDYPKQKTFFHGHTYTGNPLACGVALANLDIFATDKVLEKLAAKTEILSERLRDFWQLKAVGDIRQCGFMVGIELVKDRVTKEPFAEKLRIGHQVIMKARERGVIIRPLGDVVVLMPPLSISKVEMDELLKVTYSAIEQVTDDFV